MSLQVAYWIALGALTLCVMLKGSVPMKRTILAVLGVGLASLALARVLVWPSDVYGFAMMGLDLIAAIVILWRPAGKVQALIGLTFLLQIGVHTGKLLNGDDANLYYYWLLLSVLALLQLALIGGWWFHERLTWERPVHRSRPAARPAHRKGVG